MHHGKFHKSRGNVISMAYDEKVIMVILFQFRKNGFVIFLTNTSVTEQLNIWKITAQYLENNSFKTDHAFLLTRTIYMYKHIHG